MLSGEQSKRRQISVTVSEQLVALIDRLKAEYGMRSRGRVLETVLEDLIQPKEDPLDPPASTTESTDVTSLVLISATVALVNANE